MNDFLPQPEWGEGPGNVPPEVPNFRPAAPLRQELITLLSRLLRYAAAEFDTQGFSPRWFFLRRLARNVAQRLAD